MAELDALQRWLAQLDPSTSPVTLDALADGSVLTKLLLDINFQRFSSLAQDQQSAAAGTWVVRLNKLKRLFKLVQRTLKEAGLTLPDAGVGPHVPNLQRIAKDSAPTELVKLCRLVLAVAVQSSRKDVYVDAIVKLDPADQMLLTQAIEDLQKLSSDKPAASQASLSPTPLRRAGTQAFLTPDSTPVSRPTSQLEYDHQALQQAYTILAQENEQIKAALAQQANMPETPANEVSAEQALLAHQHAELQRFLDQAEQQVATLEAEREEQRTYVAKLERRLQQTSGTTQQVAALKAQLVDMEQLKDAAQTLERVNDKYRHKLEAMADLQRSSKILEDRNVQLQSHEADAHRQRSLAQQFKQRADVLQEEVQSLTQQVETARSSRQDHINGLEATILTASNARAQAEQEVRALQQRLVQLEPTAPSAPAPSLADELGAVSRQDYALLQERFQGTSQDCRALQHRIINLREKYAALEEKFVDTTARCAALEGTLLDKTLQPDPVLAILDRTTLEAQLTATKMRNRAFQRSNTLQCIALILLGRYLSPEQRHDVNQEAMTVQHVLDRKDFLLTQHERTIEIATSRMVKLLTVIEELRRRLEANGTGQPEPSANSLLKTLIDRITTEDSPENMKQLAGVMADQQRGMAVLRMTNDKASLLLKKQNAMIKQLRGQVATAGKRGAPDQVAALQTALDKATRLAKEEKREAETREARLRMENTLVARAFYDLSARLTQSNLSLQRTTAHPKSFLAKQRQVLNPLNG